MSRALFQISWFFSFVKYLYQCVHKYEIEKITKIRITVAVSEREEGRGEGNEENWWLSISKVRKLWSFGSLDKSVILFRCFSGGLREKNSRELLKRLTIASRCLVCLY